MSDKLGRALPPADSPNPRGDIARPATPAASIAGNAGPAPGDLASLSEAWHRERDPKIRASLAAALTDVLAHISDSAVAAAWLEAEHCTDAMRFDVARRTADADRRRIALAAIQDEQARAKASLAGEGEPVREAAMAETDKVGERASRYVPRILQQHLFDDPSSRAWSAEGTAAFVDISGFTKLSERLARKGREGAEQITDVIGRSFESILEVAYNNGGSLLKFGGDALLIWFEGAEHAERACRAAVAMRRVLREVGRIELPGAKVTLRISQGVHSGRFHFFAVGTSHVELLTTGPAWTRLVEMEHAASGGEIVISADTAATMPRRCVGAPIGPGLLLAREPAGRSQIPLIARPRLESATLARCLSSTIREHLLAGGGASEHRPVTIAFIRFEGTDAMIEQEGVAATANALHRLLSTVQAAVEAQQLTFLASDIDANGGKLILTAGAPKVTGEDEERMLLALRAIASADAPLALRIGVNRGAVFAGDIGPFYRRTYTVMGDAVNLAARLMAKATPGSIYATADVLDRSNTLFQTAALEPFMVKGKAQPIAAWSVGPATGSRTRQVSIEKLPLTGRTSELESIREALAIVRTRQGRMVEIAGESGIGKSRLLEEIREGAADFQQLDAVCEAYTSSAPYAVWRELLRELMGFGRDDPDEAVERSVRDAVLSRAADLVPWLSLLGIAFDLQMPPTPEVEMLDESNRREKLHEVVGRFLEVMMPNAWFVTIENVHQMDGASAQLLGHLAGQLLERRWLFAITRRHSTDGFVAPDSASVIRIALEPLAHADVLRLTELATEEHPLPTHVLEVVAKRSGGNPQFLRDLLRSAIASGGIGGLPASAEAATIARIDALTPADRDLLRRAAVLGLTFHPRMLAWIAEAGDAPASGDTMLTRLGEFFDEENDGYLRFRRALLRDAAYEGLPFKTRRTLHGVVAARLEEDVDQPDDIANILSLHFFEAGDYAAAWRYAATAAKRAESMYAYVEAAELYARAVDVGRRLADVTASDLARMQRGLGDAWYRAGEFPKAVEGYSKARRLAGDRLTEAELLLKHSLVEEKLGKYRVALRWASRARKALDGLEGQEAARQRAECTSWYAQLLQSEGRSSEAVRWAELAASEANAAEDFESLGDAYFIIGWAHGALGKEDAESYMQRSLDAHQRAGNRSRLGPVFANLGAIYYWKGRWDDAMACYERGRDESLKVGHVAGAAVASMNVAEILIDRGELEHAQTMLLETLRVCRTFQYRSLLAFCMLLLGRVSLRAGRFEEALGRLGQARDGFEHLGAEQSLLDVESRIAECLMAMGAPDRALDAVERTLALAAGANSQTRAVPLLRRIMGYARLQQGHRSAARAAFEAALSAARGLDDLLEVTLASLALIQLDELEGFTPQPELQIESEALLEKLRIRAVPALPTPQ